MKHITAHFKHYKDAFCERHGEYVSYNYCSQRWSGCPVCSKTRLMHSSKVEEDLKEKRQINPDVEKFLKAGISEKFLSASTENYVANTPDQKNALEAVKNYIDNLKEFMGKGEGMILVGTLGTGKTHLGSCIAIEAIKQGYTASFSTISKAILRVKSTFGKDMQESTSRALEAISSPDILVLDEIGRQNNTPFELNVTFDILNERYVKLKPTIIISNLSLMKITEFIGEAIIDRFKENGCQTIEFNWKSHRKN